MSTYYKQVSKTLKELLMDPRTAKNIKIKHKDDRPHTNDFETFYIPRIESYEGLLSYPTGKSPVVETIDVSELDFTDTRSMKRMFQGCKKLKSVDFGKNVIQGHFFDMTRMFQNCDNIEVVDLSVFTSPEGSVDELIPGWGGTITLPHFTPEIDVYLPNVQEFTHNFVLKPGIVSTRAKKVVFGPLTQIPEVHRISDYFTEHQPVEAIRAQIHIPQPMFDNMHEGQYDNLTDNATIIVY